MKEKIVKLVSLISAGIMCLSAVGCLDNPSDSSSVNGTSNNGTNSEGETPVADGLYTEDLTGSVAFDFSQTDTTKTQYIKKFDQFSTTWSFISQPGYTSPENVNAISAAEELKAESMRVDLFMGYTGIGKNIASTSTLSGKTDEEYAQAMQVLSAMDKNNIRPQLVYFANPAYSQDIAKWESVPNPTKWQELCYNIATYMENKGIRVSAHEIWNEPDLGTVYFDGDWNDYINTYIAGAKGIKGANPDNTVLGVSASWIHLLCQNAYESGSNLTKMEEFIRRSKAESILPDGISWHFYGRDCKIEDIVGLGGDGRIFPCTVMRL